MPASRRCRWWRRRRAGSSCRASRWWRRSRRHGGRRSATRSPTARDRPPTPTAAGRTCSPGACRRRSLRVGVAQQRHRRQPRPEGATAPASARWRGSTATSLAQPGVTPRDRPRRHQRHRQRAPQPAPTAADLIAAHRQLIERAHARGLKIYGATLTPFEGAAYSRRKARPSGRR